MPTHNAPITLSIAIPSPLRRLFEYLPHPDIDVATLKPGMRLSVPFGHQKALVGILVSINQGMDTGTMKLRPIHSALDDTQPSIEPDILDLCQWASQYYHYPLGEVCHLALPTLLRKAVPTPPREQAIAWQLTEQGKQSSIETFGRAKKQAEAWRFIQESQEATPETLKTAKIAKTHIKVLIDKGLVEVCERSHKAQQKGLAQAELPLNSEQKDALTRINNQTFHTYLLDGVTGSGKTEVYLQAIAKVIESGRQALVLVPEIGLTPQTVERFQQRFNVPISTLHSGISDKQRLIAWQAAKNNETPIIIGTRSAIFTPLPKLGLIIVDEEHDLSYKQQEGVRYSAKDIAIIRAQKRNIPIILGSATPALETLHNAQSGRFIHLPLRTRATQAKMPIIRCIPSDQDTLTEETIRTIQDTLDRQQQVLIFINRRGYAPTLMCQDCQWISQCNHCDSRMTFHKKTSSYSVLHCHHCDTKTQTPTQCPECHSIRLQPLGQGTQRSEEELKQRFKHTPILRIDRDSMSRKGELEAALDTINQGQPCILVGTQMLAKGHHFAKVSLAVILGLDNSFFSSDFRGAERMGQLLTQVAGRSGREQHQGQVLLQTQFSDHPLLRTLIDEGYSALAQHLLAERQLSGMPPYEHLALIRCHAPHPNVAMHFLQKARQIAEQLQPPHNALFYVGPLPATIEKRNNRYYYHLQIKAKKRGLLHHLLTALCAQLEQEKPIKGLHWLVDVDPQET